MTKNKVTHYYYHANALGSVVAVTNQTGTVAERYEYNAFGAVSMYNTNYNPIEYSAIGNTYMFTGREYDAESGLYYYRARHYSPTFGRFLQRDPIGIWEDETNLGNGYSYVGNNGVNWVDPTGEKNPTPCTDEYNNSMDIAYGVASAASLRCGYMGMQGNYLGAALCEGAVGVALFAAYSVAIDKWEKCMKDTYGWTPSILPPIPTTKNICLMKYVLLLQQHP